MPHKNLDLDLFMMCRSLNSSAFSRLPDGYRFRHCRRAELDTWLVFPFDDAETAAAHREFMEQYYERVYAARSGEFFARCIFVVDAADTPIATAFLWTAHGNITTLHWFKVKKSHEGLGIGRALLTYILNAAAPMDFPVFLHTQSGSHRAIKLYSDFGFELLVDPQIGPRKNALQDALPVLENAMSPEHFAALKTSSAPEDFIAAVAKAETLEF